MEPPDLAALQRGDESAWSQAYAWLMPCAVSIARGRLWPAFSDEVEDVAIEAIEKIVYTVREVRTVEQLKYRVVRIAHNIACSRLRYHYAQKRQLPDPPEIVVSAKVDFQLAEFVQCFLSKVNEDQRRALEMFYIDGRSYREIAQQLRMPVGRVGVLLYRGLQAARKMLSQQSNELAEASGLLRAMLWLAHAGFV